jgi:putative transposase
MFRNRPLAAASFGGIRMGKSTQLVSNLPAVFGEDLLTEGIRGKLRELIEVMLHSELDAAIQAAKYDRNQDRAGYRNGTKARTIHTSMGSVPLDVPRGRMSSFGRTKEWQSRLLPAYERRTRQLDATLVSLYFSGVNQRRVQRALRPLLSQAPLGKNVVSGLVQGLQEHLETWKTRSLEASTFVYLYLDATNLKIRLLGKVRKIPVFVALGVRQDGRKEVLAMEGLYKENENAWKELLDGLVRRKINRPLLAIVDGNAGLRSALDLVWPGIKVQRCTVHKLRNLQTYCPKSIYLEVKDSFNAIIQGVSYEAGKAAYGRFLGKWSKELPKVVRSLEEAGEELLTFYAFPQEQWKCLRTTNPIERLNGEFKRRVKTQCSLPSEDSAMLILFGLILSEQIRFRRIDGWQKIVDALSVIKQDKRQAS